MTYARSQFNAPGLVRTTAGLLTRRTTLRRIGGSAAVFIGWATLSFLAAYLLGRRIAAFVHPETLRAIDWANGGIGAAIHAALAFAAVSAATRVERELLRASDARFLAATPIDPLARGLETLLRAFAGALVIPVGVLGPALAGGISAIAPDPAHLLPVALAFTLLLFGSAAIGSLAAVVSARFRTSVLEWALALVVLAVAGWAAWAAAEASPVGGGSYTPAGIVLAAAAGKWAPALARAYAVSALTAIGTLAVLPRLMAEATLYTAGRKNATHATASSRPAAADARSMGPTLAASRLTGGATAAWVRLLFRRIALQGGDGLQAATAYFLLTISGLGAIRTASLAGPYQAAAAPAVMIAALATLALVVGVLAWRLVALPILDDAVRAHWIGASAAGWRARLRAGSWIGGTGVVLPAVVYACGVLIALHARGRIGTVALVDAAVLATAAVALALFSGARGVTRTSGGGTYAAGLFTFGYATVAVGTLGMLAPTLRAAALASLAAGSPVPADASALALAAPAVVACIAFASYVAAVQTLR